MSGSHLEALDLFYQDVRQANSRPLWMMGGNLTNEPQPKTHRHVGSTVYHVVSGQGYSVIGGKRFDWEEKDTFVVPSWAWHEYYSSEQAYLFSYNDSPLLQPFGLYREEAYPENDGHQPG